jgi:L-rhamnose isomerase
MLKALLIALLEPYHQLQQLELSGDHTGRLALLEDFKLLPVGAVWDRYCEMQNTPPAHNWLQEIKTYERTVLSKR